MARNRLVWLIGLCVLYVGLMGAESCGKQALEQIASAEGAIEDARGANAPKYAPNEFRSAEETLVLAKTQFDKWNFPKSEEAAVDAEAKARLARQIAEEEYAKWLEQMKNVQPETPWEPHVPTAEELAKQALKDVNFNFDSADLLSSATRTLTSNAAFLQQHPAVRVKIEGHCDERGNDEYNLALGARRAKAVYKFLVKQGVSASRMETISYGESLPIDPGHGEFAWSKNRRAHFAIIP